MAEHAKPSILIVLLTQSLSVVGELCGQRMARRVHKGSIIRLLLAVVLYSSVQGWLLTTAAELWLPRAWTGGQGGLSMWAMLWQHPGLWVGALVNVVYWIAQAYVLREPLGVVLVVLAFVLASFLVDPFSAAVGLPTSDDVSVAAILLGLAGSLLCLWELSVGNAERAEAAARAALAWLTCFYRCASDRAARYAAIGKARAGWRDGSQDRLTAPDAVDADGSDEGGGEHGGGRGGDAHAAAIVLTDLSRPGAGGLDTGGGPSSSRAGSGTGTGTGAQPQSRLFVGSLPALCLAFFLLASMAGIGIVFAVYFERTAGLSSVGYAAMDQVLLPFTTVPVLLAAARWRWLGRAIGEPQDAEGGAAAAAAAAVAQPWGALAWGLLRQTWAETHVPTLVTFRLLQFAREFLFFFLATQFDLASTYLEMTLIRVVLSWASSVLAVTLLRAWVGVGESEVRGTLAPANIAMRLAGTALIAAAVVLLNQR